MAPEIRRKMMQPVAHHWRIAASIALALGVVSGAVAQTQDKPVGEAEGVIKGVDAGEHKLMITHGPISGGHRDAGHDDVVPSRARHRFVELGKGQENQIYVDARRKSSLSHYWRKSREVATAADLFCLANGYDSFRARARDCAAQHIS
jgi:hypothetical protein